MSDDYAATQKELKDSLTTCPLSFQLFHAATQKELKGAAVQRYLLPFDLRQQLRKN